MTAILAARRGTWREERALVILDGGLVTVGTDRPELPRDGEGPSRRVRLRPFGISRYAVTNGEFNDFVRATGYVTDAERFGWSYVFHLLMAEGGPGLEKPTQSPWWRRVEGACWRTPEGPQSSIADRHDHPAVHVSWNDAVAFSTWAGARLPTEAEWEYAAAGGLDQPRFPWGDVEPTDDVVRCNIWQGSFPDRNTMFDGYLGTAPVGSFDPNGFGLYNMAGNVWEWCWDSFLVRSVSNAAKIRNKQARAENEKVLKGGSYLCHRSYCYRYRVAARTGRSRDTSAGNTGFRVAADI